MLKLAGEESGIQERIENIYYIPMCPNTGDLEAGTKTITATAEASGIENADYSKALTLAKPDDARLVVNRIASRLAVTIDSFDTATHLYCRVYVDAQDAEHRLFDEDWDSTGARLAVVDTHSGARSTIFDLLKDGAAHTFYFFFWVNQANNAVISSCELWEAVGTCATGYTAVLQIVYKGSITFIAHLCRIGTGTPSIYISRTGEEWYVWQGKIGHDAHFEVPNIIVCDDNLCVLGTVTTDLNYLSRLLINAKSLA